MIAIQATYDGKNFKPLLSEQLPEVTGEVPVAIVFLEEGGVGSAKPGQDEKRRRQLESALRMRARRDAMEPLGITVAELLEEGRHEH